MAGSECGRGGPPARARYFERHIFYAKNTICICKIFFLIRYIHTNTNIGPFTKLFLWFRLVINLFAIRFKSLVSQILNFFKVEHIFSSSKKKEYSQASPAWGKSKDYLCIPSDILSHNSHCWPYLICMSKKQSFKETLWDY
ncbi:hypothetical protein Hanom_Chr02g00137591 [Helianthus anomalus]